MPTSVEAKVQAARYDIGLSLPPASGNRDGTAHATSMPRKIEEFAPGTCKTESRFGSISVA